jgi:dTDP-4-amino-4,6-dideoxygalactose transaminase
VDIEKNYFGLCPEALLKTIQKQKISAVIQVHIGGHISPSTPKIASICKREGLKFIEDCSHSHGAHFKGVMAGNFGDMGCFSLFTTKVLTAGEGGILVTNNKTLYEKAVSIRQFGFDLKNPISHIYWGSNFKLSEFPALLALMDLERLTERLNKRRILAKRYQQNLANSQWIAIKDPPGGEGSYYKQVIIQPVKRELIERAFKRKKIFLTGGVYYQPLHLQPIYKNNHKIKHFPVAENFSSRHICPPCYPELDLDTIDYICDVMLSIHK